MPNVIICMYLWIGLSQSLDVVNIEDIGVIKRTFRKINPHEFRLKKRGVNDRNHTDDVKIVNKHDFKFILNPGEEICKPLEDRPIYLLIYVHSAPKNFKRRLCLRETWTRRSMFRDVRVVFMMGDVDEADRDTRHMLELENGIYQDIVQEDFQDAYRNLTYKGIMAMKWISQYCQNAKHILKVDDDILSNIFILLRHLRSLENHNMAQKNTIMCLVWVGMVSYPPSL